MSSSSSITFPDAPTEEPGKSAVSPQQASGAEADCAAPIPNGSIGDPPHFLPLQNDSNHSGDLLHGGRRLNWHRSLDQCLSDARGVAFANVLNIETLRQL